MARLKRSSRVLERALRRLAGMRSIAEPLQLNNGISVFEYETRIQTLQTKILDYNTQLSALDEMLGEIKLLEQDLATYSETMLMAIAMMYGKDSLPYMQAGGKPRKTSKRLAKAPLTTSLTDATPEPMMIASASDPAKTNGRSRKTTAN